MTSQFSNITSPRFSMSRPSSSGSRPSSITRSSRESFASELELLPPENDNEVLFELAEEVLEIENISDGEDPEDPNNTKNESFGKCEVYKYIFTTSGVFFGFIFCLPQ